MKIISTRTVFLSILILILSSPGYGKRTLVARSGKGYLETVNGYPVMHLKGTPQQMGTQHGKLLKEKIKRNVDFLLGNYKSNKNIEVAGIKIPKSMIARYLISVFESKIPQDYMTEMNALARASDIQRWKIIAANLIPELFHCSGFALLHQATADKKLYHGRILDYGVDWKLQENYVLIIAQPEGKIPFVNVSYAGFIGSVTGMNLQQISIGEMGGAGVGQWNGVPMSFLVRKVLDSAASLEEAIAVFKQNPRTCEYYYVIADAQINDAVGIRAVPDKLEIVRPGQPHKLLPEPVQNTVILSAGDRYRLLRKKINQNYGNFTSKSAIRLMDRPVAMKSNLHNALMVPQDAVIYIANADKKGNPACNQKYYRFDIKQLIKNDKTSIIPATD